ncbi:unnamed protein product [Camellia sinensis]
MIPRKRKTGKVPVHLNVYDLTPINGYAYWLGLGVYHSGVLVHGVEYAFGAHDHPTTGIFEVEPKHCPGFTFRKSILIGRTDMGPKEVRTFMEKLAEEYSGNTYNLITKNCNHFCNDACLRLTGKPIPRWVNRLARLGDMVCRGHTSLCDWLVHGPPNLGFLCNCVLPAGLNETKVRHIREEDRAYEKKKLRSDPGRFISPSGSEARRSRHRSHPPPSPSPSLIYSSSPSPSTVKL